MRHIAVRYSIMALESAFAAFNKVFVEEQQLESEESVKAKDELATLLEVSCIVYSTLLPYFKKVATFIAFWLNT